MLRAEAWQKSITAVIHVLATFLCMTNKKLLTDVIVNYVR